MGMPHNAVITLRYGRTRSDKTPSAMLAAAAPISAAMPVIPVPIDGLGYAQHVAEEVKHERGEQGESEDDAGASDKDDDKIVPVANVRSVIGGLFARHKAAQRHRADGDDGGAGEKDNVGGERAAEPKTEDGADQRCGTAHARGHTPRRARNRFGQHGLVRGSANRGSKRR